MDVVGLAQFGVMNAVATLGTATSAFHIKKLMRQTDTIIFVLMEIKQVKLQRGVP